MPTTYSGGLRQVGAPHTRNREAPETHANQDEESEGRKHDQGTPVLDGPPFRADSPPGTARVLLGRGGHQAASSSGIAMWLVSMSSVEPAPKLPAGSTRVEPRGGCHRSRNSRPRRPSNSCM